jgi:4-carboxymuconolactone decarboxylase
MELVQGMQPENLSPAQRALYDEIIQSRGGPEHLQVRDATGALLGPFNAMLLSPGVGMALQRLGTALRRQTSLPERARELAVLCVAAHWDSEFEWQSHAPLALSAGVSDEVLAQLRARTPPLFDTDQDRHVYEVVQQLLAGRVPTPGHGFSPQVLFELSTLVGYYATLALQLRVFGVDGSA